MIEKDIVIFFNKLGSGSFIDNLSIFVSLRTFLFFLFFIVSIFIFYYDKKNFKRFITILLIALILNIFVTEIIFKEITVNFFGERNRPYVAYPIEIIQLGRGFSDSSFPSTHLSTITAALTVIWYFYPKTWKYCFVFIVILAFSRMHNGMHYPSDILAGVILGIVSFYLALKLTNYLLKKQKN